MKIERLTDWKAFYRTQVKSGAPTTRGSIVRYLGDQALRFFQRRCEHPPEMVASDITEGVHPARIRYCNRCGAFRFDDNSWRRPDPNLWRGK